MSDENKKGVKVLRLKEQEELEQLIETSTGEKVKNLYLTALNTSQQIKERMEKSKSKGMEKYLENVEKFKEIKENHEKEESKKISDSEMRALRIVNSREYQPQNIQGIGFNKKGKVIVPNRKNDVQYQNYLNSTLDEESLFFKNLQSAMNNVIFKQISRNAFELADLFEKHFQLPVENAVEQNVTMESNINEKELNVSFVTRTTSKVRQFKHQLGDKIKKWKSLKH